MTTLADRLWGQRARFIYLFIAAIILLCGALNGRELWTQEHRWADIVANMLYTHDFFHPQLEGNDYYDKPLLSYWLMAGIAKLTGQLSLWALRLPSALAGLIAIFAMYRIGLKLKNKQFGLLAGWCLLTTIYFVFWARVSSADMLNLAGALAAVWWYVEKRDAPRFKDFVIFFLILAVTALCKGLVGVVVAGLVVLCDVILRRAFKQYLSVSVFLAILPALIVYIAPFIVSAYFSTNNFHENGLYLVYRENILRYFKPFDHVGPVYLYLIYLPIYLLPWTLFFIPALWQLKSRWSNLSLNAKWMVLATGILFLFFTISGSRRSYYILPMIPYALLMTAEWILAAPTVQSLRNRLAGMLASGTWILLALFLLVIQPLYYSGGGIKQFAPVFQAEIVQPADQKPWHFILIDAQAKLVYHLQLPPNVESYGVSGNHREFSTTASIVAAFPVLKHIPPHTIIITRSSYVPLLQPLLVNYKVIVGQPTLGERMLHVHNVDEPAAFIPRF